jgi:cation-transporting P-type ATPase I
MTSTLRETARTVLDLFGPRTRRSFINRTRAHVEIKKLAQSELAAFTRAVKKEFELPRVQWVEVNPALFRVVVAFEDGALSLAEIVEHVENAERSVGVHNAAFQDTSWEHPADVETAQRLMVELAADAFGAVAGFGLKFTPVPASRLSGTVASLLQIVQTSPRLRRVLDDRFGPLRADLQLSVGAALAFGVAQRPGSALVELLHRAVQLSEVRARRSVWEQRESVLFGEPSEQVPAPAALEARPRPLPRGPIEEYADRAVWVSLGGFAISLLTTRSVQRAVAALFGGVPKPARLGRDVFAAELGRSLSKRGILVVDPEAVRRLDRLDCLVLSSDLVAQSRFVVRKLCPVQGEDEEALREVLTDLFDADEPLARREQDGMFVTPLGMCLVALPEELESEAGELGAQGGLAFAIGRGRDVVALAEVELLPRTGIEEIVSAAHEAGMRVVVASGDDAVLEGLAADDIISENEGLLRGVRRLQREGRAVCLVAGAPDPALAAADCTIGIYRDGSPPPWGSHILCSDDLSEVRFLINACVTARQVAKQSVNIALSAATLGALVSAGGVLPLTGRRVIRVVNGASLVAMLNGARGSFQLDRQKLPPPRDRTPWHALEGRAVLTKLGTSKEEGLSRRDTLERRRKLGAPRSSFVELFEAVSDELFNPLAPLLAAGAALSAAVGSFGDAAMVGGVVSLNALVGGVQRFRTERAIRELARTTRRRAMVRRSGQLYDIDATDLVHGDIIVLTAGDVVPADCRIIEAESLEVDSSSMTGESLPVRKSAQASFEAAVPDRSSMLYESTSIAAGRALAVVVAVGDETEARRGSVASKHDPSRGGVERRLRSLIQLTGPIALGAGVGLIGAGLLRGRKLEDLVGSGVSLAVASVPEGLPLLATAAQLAAADRLARRGALVRNVRSIEALGRIDVLCVDKTGTLTEGRIELGSVTDGALEQRLPELDGMTLPVLAAALRASPAPSNARHFDQIDGALRRAAEELSIDETYDRGSFRRHWELSFEAMRGYHATFSDHEGGSAIDVKGAPETVLPRCTSWKRRGQRSALDAVASADLMARANELARRGLRVLGVAERLVARGDSLDPERLVGLTFLGFLAFRDPVRSSAARAINDLAAAGVRTIMLTGDHPSTAQAVARELGLVADDSVITGAELTDLPDDELDRRIRKVTVFARVTPPQKVRIVRALQRAGRVVAMVGDGANDAPAIRLANVGIALGEQSTTAARAAADIVLTDERIETLVHAVSEGRAMWASVRDAVSILVGGNLGEIGFMLGAGLVDGRPPLNPRQLLLVNLLTDVAPAMAIALRPPSAKTLASLANEGPDASLGQPLNREIAVRAAVTALGASTAWAVGRFTGTRLRANTVGLIALVGTQLGQTLVSGRFSRPVVITSIGSAAILGLIVQTPGLSQVFGCTPLGPVGWATALGSSALATSASVYYPEVAERIFGRFGFKRPVLVEDPEALPPGDSNNT